MTPGPVSTTRVLALVGRGVLIETIRRKEFYVLAILVGAFALVAIGARVVGVEKPATGTFLLNLGMTIASAAAHILTLMTAVRQIPSEIENRTIHPLLAKPLSRTEYLVGKWLAVTLTGIVVWIVLLATAYLPVPKLEDYSQPLFLQTILLQFLSIGMLAALGICLSIFIPQAVNLVALGLLFFAGEKIARFISGRFVGTETERLAEYLSGYVPAFANLNTITRFTDGMGPIDMGSLAGLALYAVIISTAALTLACHAFNRRPL